MNKAQVRGCHISTKEKRNRMQIGRDLNKQPSIGFTCKQIFRWNWSLAVEYFCFSIRFCSSLSLQCSLLGGQQTHFTANYRKLASPSTWRIDLCSVLKHQGYFFKQNVCVNIWRFGMAVGFRMDMHFGHFVLNSPDEITVLENSYLCECGERRMVILC